MKRVLYKIIILAGLIGGVVLIFKVTGMVREGVYMVIYFWTKSSKVRI